MCFPAGILQSPNYDINKPDYINYGSFGVTLSHELTHVYDNKRRTYDSEGLEFNWSMMAKYF